MGRACEQLYLKYRDGEKLIATATPFLLSTTETGERKVFTTFSTQLIHRSINGQPQIIPAVLHLDYHLERLIENAEAAGIRASNLKEHSATFLKRELITNLQKLLPKRPTEPKYLRVRAVLSTSGADLFFEFHKPRWPIGTTIKVVTTRLERTEANIKSTNLTHLSDARSEAAKAAAEEALLISKDGFVREGTWANVFWFSASGQLITPKTDILPGITRRIILENFPCQEEDVSLTDFLSRATEVFVTQSTTGITPVTQVDDKVIGSGKAGPNTLRLQKAYWELVEKISEPIHEMKNE